MKHLTTLLFVLFYFFSFSQPGLTVIEIDTITAAGGNFNNADPYFGPGTYIIRPSGGGVNLVGNYNLDFGTTPPSGGVYTVYVDSGFNLNAHTFTVFGQVMSQFQLNTFSQYVITINGLNKKVMWQFCNDAGEQTINYTTTFNDSVIFNGPIIINSSVPVTVGAIPIGIRPGGGVVSTCTACDSLNKFWRLLGNSGTNSGTNFVGTTDTANFELRVNNSPSGKIENTQNLSTAFGYRSLKNETFVSVPNGNAAFGWFSLTALTTAQSNTAIGSGAGLNITTGSFNAVLGASSLSTNITGTHNTAIGTGADVSTSSTNYGTSIGYNAVSSNNQIAFSPNARSFSLPGFSSAVDDVLTDTSGTGGAIFKPILTVNYLTSVTGDSVLVASKTTVQENPGGTLGNLTYILPSNPVNGAIIHFVTTQILSAIHWSVRLEPGNTTNLLPSSATAGQAWAIQYSSNANAWFLFQ